MLTDLERELLEALRAAEHMHQTGLLFMTAAEIERAHELRRTTLAAAERKANE